MTDQPTTQNQDQPTTKRTRVSHSEQERLKKQLRPRYERGASIRQLVAETGRSYGTVHRLLRQSGVQLRGRGGTNRGGSPQPLGVIEIIGELVSPSMATMLTVLNTANRHVTASWIKDQLPDPATTIDRALNRLVDLNWVTVHHRQPTPGKRPYGRRYQITDAGRTAAEQIPQPAS